MDGSSIFSPIKIKQSEEKSLTVEPERSAVLGADADSDVGEKKTHIG